MQPMDAAVIGAGVMGRGIVQWLLLAGHRVILYDADAAALERARDHVTSTFTLLVGKNKLDRSAADAATGRLILASGLDDLAPCGLVIEAIIERLDAKQSLFKAVEAVVGHETILASNTSSLSITAIASACEHPERVAGLHFFNPAPRMKLVEVIGGVRTLATVIEQLTALVEAAGHKAVRASDTPGFVVNHASRGLLTESLRILSEGITDPVTLDRVLRDAAGFRMGSCEFLDMVGLDVSLPVMESIYHQYYEEPRYRPSFMLAQRLAGGLLGRKSDEGFYRYLDGLAQVPPEVPVPDVAPPAVWIDPRDRQRADTLRARLQSVGVEFDRGDHPAEGSLCLLLPVYEDATSAAIACSIEPRHAVAVDTWLPDARRTTLMTTPITQPCFRDAAHALFARIGPVALVHDSPGFVVPRVLAMIVNIACDMAQQRIAGPDDIDAAVRLGLHYPQGPLAWGDQLGAANVLALLASLQTFYHDPRYRPSPWLTRRARLGVSLLTPEG